MKVLVDAQLPQRLAQFLSTKDIDSKHTLELPDKNATSDNEIIKVADKEDRVVISKDSDFWDDYILEGHPQKLLIVRIYYVASSPDDQMQGYDRKGHSSCGASQSRGNTRRSFRQSIHLPGIE